MNVLLTAGDNKPEAHQGDPFLRHEPTRGTCLCAYCHFGWSGCAARKDSTAESAACVASVMYM
jgi:hypothetical protein